MSHIMAFVSTPVADHEGGMQFNGFAYVSPDSVEVQFSTGSIAWTATPAQINNAIRDAAIAAAEADPFNFTIGALDNKTVMACAVGLI
jgi:hypothetical protein